MLCALFKSYMLLATSHTGEAQFYARALISLVDMRVESVDDGRGTR